jgi:cytochrome c-type biogenesis protein CcmH/NrfG
MSATTNNIEQLYQRGFDLRCEGRYGEARMALQSVLAKDPAHLNAKHQLALIQGFEGDFDGSVASLTALSAAAPRNLDILFDLAMTQMMIGMMDEACGNFRAMLKIEPGNDKASKQVIYCP